MTVPVTFSTAEKVKIKHHSFLILLLEVSGGFALYNHFNSRKELLSPVVHELDGLQVSLDLMIKEKYPPLFQELTFGCLAIIIALLNDLSQPMLYNVM